MHRHIRTFVTAAVAVAVLAGPGSAAIQITEWMYRGAGGGDREFIEFTNLGSTPVDMTGWSFDDNSREPGTFDLSGFGVVQPGESVVLTEAMATEFRLWWSLAGTVKVVGDLSANLGNGDEINLFDAADGLVDRLTYGSTPRTDGASATVPFADLAMTTASESWALAVNGDAFGSWANSLGDVGNPGAYVPEPASLALLAIGAMALRRRRA